jgi:hypothetical protein
MLSHLLEVKTGMIRQAVCANVGQPLDRRYLSTLSR